jgi:HEAT repeat protein
MSHTEVRRHIELLQSSDPIDRLRGASGLGRIADTLRTPGKTLRGGDYSKAVISLAEALRTPGAPLVQSESAWALGRIGGIPAVRRLLNRLKEVFPISERRSQVLGQQRREGSASVPAYVRASLITAIGKGLSEEVLRKLNEEDIDSLRQRLEILLNNVAEEPDENVRVAAVETIVALNVRATRAGLSLLPDLTNLLHGKESFAVLAAIALLNETVPGAREIAAQRHRRPHSQEPNQEVEGLLEQWSQQLEVWLGGWRPGREKLVEWLDLAMAMWDLREAAQIV